MQPISVGVHLKDPKRIFDFNKFWGMHKAFKNLPIIVKKKVKISPTAIVMWTVLSHFDNLQVLQSRPPRSPLHALQKLFFFGDMFPLIATLKHMRRMRLRMRRNIMPLQFRCRGEFDLFLLC